MKPMKITIFHTNDIHSRLEDFTKIITLLKELKTDDDLLLDAGDFHDFMRIEMNGTKGKVGKQLLDYANYDALTVGNNETFSGITNLEFLAGYGNTKTLSCNIIKNDRTTVNNILPAIIVNKKNINFLIIGISPNINDFSSTTGITVLDTTSAITDTLEKYKGHYDFSIALSHLGYNDDITIAKEELGIDIIIGGHSHTLMKEALKIKNTIMNQAGNYAEHLGVLELEIINKEIISYQGKSIAVNDIIEDTQALEIIHKAKEEAVKNLSQPLYHIDEVLFNDPILENPLTNLICDQLLLQYPCDFALMHSGICSSGISGDISKFKLLKLSPSPLNPTLFKVSGKDLLEAFHQSLDIEKCLHLQKWAGFRGLFLGRLHVSNNVSILNTDQELQVLIDQKPLDANQIYTIISDDFLLRGSGYESLKNGQLIEYKGEYIRDTLELALRNKELIKLAFTTRWFK